MRTIYRTLPLEAMLDRRAGVRGPEEFQQGIADLLFAIPKFDVSDVAFEIDGDCFDEDDVTSREVRSVFRLRDCHARRHDAVVADEYRGAFVRWIDVEPIDAQDSRWRVRPRPAM